MEFKVGQYKVFDYPMQDQQRQSDNLARFYERNRDQFDPKKANSTGLSNAQNEARLFDVHTTVVERYTSCRKAIERDLNSDDYQTQYHAFEALGVISTREYYSQMQSGNHISSYECSLGGTYGTTLVNVDLIPEGQIYIGLKGIGRAYKMFSSYDLLSEHHALQHQQVNFQLATDYYQTATSYAHLRNENIIYYGPDTPEYFEALCIFHFELASNLGDARATLELAKLYYNNEFFLPYKRWIDHRAIADNF